MKQISWKQVANTVSIGAMLINLTAPSEAVAKSQSNRPVVGPSDVLGMWGVFDERTGTCTPDAAGVELTSTTFRVDFGGHSINVRPIGQAKCQGNRCIVTTTATPKSRIWTWVFRSADTAIIQGNFPHWTEKEGDEGVVGFELTLRRGCPG